jgi:hypothetical protein
VAHGQAWEEAFVAYYAAKGEMLRRTAFALCGDWHLAEAGVPRPGPPSLAS